MNRLLIDLSNLMEYDLFYKIEDSLKENSKIRLRKILLKSFLEQLERLDKKKNIEYDEAYDKGYDKGYDEGYKLGNNDGYLTSQDEAVSELNSLKNEIENLKDEVYKLEEELNKNQNMES